MLWQSFKEFRSWFLHETLSLYVAWKKMDWQLLHSPERTLPPLCSGSINWCCLSCVRVHPKVESFNSENSKQFRNPRASNRNSSKHLVTKHSWLMTHILALHCRRKQFIMDSWVHDFSHRNHSHRVESFILTWSTPKFIQETAVADLPQPPHLSLVQGLSWANWLPLQDLSSYPTNVKTCYISTSHLSILSHTTHINTCWPSPQRTSLWPMTCEALKLFRGGSLDSWPKNTERKKKRQENKMTVLDMHKHVFLQSSTGNEETPQLGSTAPGMKSQKSCSSLEVCRLESKKKSTNCSWRFRIDNSE